MNGPSSTKLHLFLHWNKKSNSCVGCGFQSCFAVLCLHLFPASVALLTDKNKHRITELPLEQTDSVSSTRGQTKCICLAFLGCDAGRCEFWTGSARSKHRFCAADTRAGGALTRVRVELQLPQNGAGRVTGHGRKMGWGSGCGRSRVLPAVWGQGIKEPLQNSCCAGPGLASEGVKCLLLSVRFIFVDVLTYSRTEPMVTSNCGKLPRVLRFLPFTLVAWAHPPSPSFLRGITDFQALFLCLSIVFCQFVDIWQDRTKFLHCVGQRGDVAILFLTLVHDCCFSFILIF